MKIIVGNEKKKKKKKKNVIVKNNIAIRIAGKVSRYIDASMNRATPSIQNTHTRLWCVLGGHADLDDSGINPTITFVRYVKHDHAGK